VDGPAVERPDGSIEFYVDGKELTQEKFEILFDKSAQLTV
jgi:hypothetical protein